LYERLKARGDDGSAVDTRHQRNLAELDAMEEEARRPLRLPPKPELPKLERASEQAIHDETVAVYDDAEKRGARPPNKLELPGIVQRRLREHGLKAKRDVIRDIADRPEFSARRLKQGKHYKRST
jgi:hypothetical protein